MSQGTGQKLRNAIPIQSVLLWARLGMLRQPNQKPGVDQSNARTALLVYRLTVSIFGRMRKIIAFHRSL
jgi:hypothetical protein